MHGAGVPFGDNLTVLPDAVLEQQPSDPRELLRPQIQAAVAQGMSRRGEAARRSLELRGDDGTGWSLGWKINHWARLRDGDHALRLIDMQLRPVDPNPAVNYRRGGTYPNLFDAHPPFQIDGNFGYTSGVCEMLLQWEPGRLHLLPALPKAWRSGAVSGLRAPGGLEVGMSWQDGELTGLDIRGDVSGLRMTLFGRDFVYNQ